MAETLRRLRESVTIPYEVVILDNSSTPTASGKDFADNERYEFLGENLGTVSRNIGVEKSQGTFVLMLDDDSHPLPGALEKAVAFLTDQPDEVVGLGARVERLDGGREGPPLLPTVFHGCGALFRKDALAVCGTPYPKEFGFYAEEYWVAFLLHSKGFSIGYTDDFRVCHRMSSSGRSKKRILFHLVRNNDCIWKAFTPDRYLEDVLYDTNRRYELIARHEGVPEAYAEARQQRLVMGERKTMSESAFKKASLLSSFENSVFGRGKRAARFPNTMLLCGVGKFPSLWAKHLRAAGVKDVILSDFNKALWGKDFNGFIVVSPDEALMKAQGGAMPYVGHSSRADSDTWRELLAAKSLTYKDIVL